MRNIFICILLVVLFSCRKDKTENQIPFRYDVPVLFSATVDSFGLRQIDFRLKLAVLRGNNETEDDIVEYTNIPDTSFKFYDYQSGSSWVRYQINNIDYLKDETTVPYFTSIMLDQSSYPESFDLNDMFNLRFQAINGYLKRLTGNGEVLLSGFARNGRLSDNIEYCNNEPISLWERTTAENLLGLTHKTGGTSCLFDALNSMMDKMIPLNKSNKSIVLLVINKDDSLSSVTQEEVIQKAKANNIRINLIWLIDDWHNVDFSTLTELPCRTGGFLIYMGDRYQVSTIFLGLDKLLTRKVNYYHLDVKLTVDSPKTFALKYTDGIKIFYPETGYYTWNYIPFILTANGKK